MAAMPRMKALKDESVKQKMGIAFMLMSLIPFLMMLSIFYNVAFPQLEEESIKWVRWALFWMICFSMVGFLLAQRVAGSVVRVAKDAKAISEGDLSQEITTDEANEIGELARSFNRITRDLERKILELEESRDLMKRLLERVGTAMSSYRGLDDILDLILENLNAAVSASSCAVFLASEEGDSSVLKSAWGASTRWQANGENSIEDSFVDVVFKECRTLRISASSMGEHREEARVYLPLQRKGAVIGVLAAEGKQTADSFSQDDEALMENVGSQIAMAVENYRLNEDVEQSYIQAILALAMAVEARDPYTMGHAKRVGAYSEQIAEVMGLDEETMKTLKHGAVLHDVGKIGIRDDVLLKPEPLNDEEFELMKEHAVIGEAIVRPIRSLGAVADLVRSHQEKFDGSGYPDGLAGDDIPLTSRIIMVADAYDAMITDRPYRKRMPLLDAAKELQKHAGTQFDPDVVNAFVRSLAERFHELEVLVNHDTSPTTLTDEGA